jgi:YVTN family beta-propeller protein
LIGSYAYVSTNGINVYVIDTATNTVTATLKLENSPIAFGQFIVPPQHGIYDKPGNKTILAVG